MKSNAYAHMSPCVRAVVDAVANVYGLVPMRITRNKKRSRGAYARDIAVYICRAELGMGWEEIAEEFAFSSPGVMYSVNRVAKLVAACDVRALAGVCAGENAAEPFNGAAAE